MTWGMPEHQRKTRFSRTKWSAGASPIRFRRTESGGWGVTCGPSALALAYGPAGSVSEGMRIFREAENRYWKTKMAQRPKSRRPE